MYFSFSSFLVLALILLVQSDSSAFDVFELNARMPVSGYDCKVGARIQN